MARAGENVGRWGGHFDACLDVTPPVTEEQLGRIPAKRGVMGLLGPAGQVVLLTTAADIRARLRNRLQQRDQDERKKTADLREVTRQVLWKLASSHFETDLLFLDLARLVWPGRFAKMLAWRQPWFVHVDPAEDYPHFRRLRGAVAEAGVLVGPFAVGRSAERFIEAVEDAFDLCRHPQHLRQAPHGPRCTYAEMSRCLCPCDGTIPLGEYRQTIARAAEFAAGRREAVREDLAARMRAAAKELAFERAASLKKRLDRLAVFDGPAWRDVGPAESFRFLLVQTGPTRRQASVFLADRGRVKPAAPLEYPLQPKQLARTLHQMRQHLASPAKPDPADPWRLALVAYYLLAGEDRRGLMLRWRDDLTAEQLGEAIENAKEPLKLRAPKPRKKKSDAESPPADAPSAGEAG